MVGKSKTNAVILAIVLVVLSLIFTYQYTENIDHKNTITAMDAFAISESIAENHSRGSVLCSVTKVGDVSVDGSVSGWRFYYISHINGSLYHGFDVTVYSKENTKIYEYGEGNSTEVPIENWTIDSDEAYSIAMKSEKIKEYMDRYGDATVDGFYLTMPSENSTHPVWTIYFMAGGVDLSPHNAHIIIDATTGEVTYVEADLTSHSWTNDMCCMSSLMGIVLIVASAVLIVRKKSMKEQEKRRLEEEKINMEKEIRKWDEEHGKKG